MKHHKFTTMAYSCFPIFQKLFKYALLLLTLCFWFRYISTTKKNENGIRPPNFSKKGIRSPNFILQVKTNVSASTVLYPTHVRAPPPHTSQCRNGIWSRFFPTIRTSTMEMETVSQGAERIGEEAYDTWVPLASDVERGH